MGSVKWTSGGQAFLGAVATLLLGHAKGPGWWRTTQRTYGQATATADRQTTSQSVTNPGPNPTNRTAPTARTFLPAMSRSIGPFDRNQHPVSTDWQEESPVRLKVGQLGTADLTASTVANIGLGGNFYFGATPKPQGEDARRGGVRRLASDVPTSLRMDVRAWITSRAWDPAAGARWNHAPI
jgi:hypothetical protein